MNKHANISESWENNRSEAKKMHKILFRDFEGANVSCSHGRKQEFLNENGREHVKEPTEEENKKIGCHRSQIAMSKIAQVKDIKTTTSRGKFKGAHQKNAKGRQEMVAGRRETSTSPTKQR
jgi:hypothetical protein